MSLLELILSEIRKFYKFAEAAAARKRGLGRRKRRSRLRSRSPRFAGLARPLFLKSPPKADWG